MFKDSKYKLSVFTALSHWVIAAMFIGMVAVGLTLEEMTPSQEKTDLLNLHKSIGLIFFLLAVVRVVHRSIQGFPEDLSEKPSWQKKFAKISHWTLLIATITAPITGMLLGYATGTGLNFFGTELSPAGPEVASLLDIGHILHALSTVLVMMIVIIHALAAIKQQFVDRTLSRMLGFNVE